MKKEKDCIYCLNCVYGEGLIKAIDMNSKIPNKCKTCNPSNPRLGASNKERPNYIEFNVKKGS